MFFAFFINMKSKTHKTRSNQLLSILWTTSFDAPIQSIENYYFGVFYELCKCKNKEKIQLLSSLFNTPSFWQSENFLTITSTATILFTCIFMDIGGSRFDFRRHFNIKFDFSTSFFLLFLFPTKHLNPFSFRFVPCIFFPLFFIFNNPLTWQPRRYLSDFNTFQSE